MKSWKLLVVSVVLLTAERAHAEVVWTQIVPKDTEPKIKEFNTPHLICVDDALIGAKSKPEGKNRHQLLVFLPGTNGHGQGGKAFLETAAKLGYHTIELMYPNDLSASVCSRDRDPAAFTDFRLAVIQGGNTKHISVDAADSIENRLERLLVALVRKQPQVEWEQFLKEDGVNWDRIALAGQSQGGGHAALMGMRHHVARVIMFGAPKDYSDALGRPAAWYSQKSATPVSGFFAINHRQDRQACSFQEQLQNLVALKLNALGGPVDVDGESAPFRHSHILVTNFPGKTVESKVAHGTALSDRNVATFLPVWNYMLTEIAK